MKKCLDTLWGWGQGKVTREPKPYKNCDKMSRMFLCVSYNLLHRGMGSAKRRLRVESMLEIEVRGLDRDAVLRL